MTLTDLSAAPHRRSALPSPSPGEVLMLQAMRDYPAVSVLCTTTPGRQMTRDDAARLAALVADAEGRLIDELGEADSAQHRAELDRLAQDVTARPAASSTALYVSDRHSSAWSLPVPVADRVIIDPTFATRDLVRSLHRTPRHVVLILTDHEARLFDGVGETLLPPYGGPFPIRADRPSRGPRRGRPARTLRGTDVVEQGDAFLRLVDQALGAYLQVHPAPLVLVGTPRIVSQFRHLSRNTKRLAGVVGGSHARTSLPDLVARIRPVLEAYLRSRQDEALALLEQQAGAGRVVGGMAAVWLAARTERPEMLAVEQGLFSPARLSAEGDFLIPASDVDHPDVIDDTVDEAIEIVLRRGGWVALVEDGLLSEYDGIALSLRRR